MAENPKQNLQSTEIMAKLFELDPRRVQQLAKEGVLPAASQRPYKFDLLPTVKAYIRYLRDRANGKEAKTADTVKAEADKLRAEADLKQSKAKIAELQLKELEGKMHRSEDVEAMTNDLVYTARSMIMALPGRLAMDVVQAGSANEASALIRAECYKILNELAGYQYDPEVYRRRVRDREGWSDALADEEADE
jgi:phage terminase Nu1 subunit (DNA packaging protein)